MLDIDTDALDLVLETLGRGTPATALGRTDFDDEILQQVLDVQKLVRRARAPRNVSGMYATGLSTTGDGAGAVTRTATVDPYTLVPGVTAANSWPTAEQMKKLDVWLLGINAGNVAVAGNFASARLFLSMPNVPFNATWVPTGTGSSTGLGTLFSHLWWADTEKVIGNFNVLIFPDAPLRHFPVRVPRGASVVFQTTTTGAGASVYQANLLVGVFPRALGQDAFGAG